MTEIKLTNTKTRQKDVFVPIDDTNVRMYVCGPTVYDRAHIGNARPVIVFDVLYRLLREIYGADHVTYVRNFTDVDDKINARAAASGRTINEITDETIQWYLDDMRAVGALDPDQMPRATQYIPQMIAMIEELIAKGHAYSDGAGHVLFSVDSYAKYGALSGRSTDDMIAGARVEVADYKRDPMDFVLWKPSVGDQPGWDSPWGVGRPGWHIECSAMAKDLLGDHFDIHGGGNDLMFPHHENEIAQSCCASGHADDGSGFANVWLHNEMLQVEGKKMSKSLGNFFTVRDLLDQGVAGEVIRFVFLSTHYRKPMDWTQKKWFEADQVLVKWFTFVHQNALSAEEVSELYIKNDIWVPDEELVGLLANDLNTAGALNRLRSVFIEAQSSPTPENKARFAASLELVGLLPTIERLQGFLQLRNGFDLSAYADRLATLRATAMETKDFGPVDALKTALLDAGVEVRMSKTGVELDAGPTFDASKLEVLL